MKNRFLLGCALLLAAGVAWLASAQSKSASLAQAEPSNRATAPAGVAVTYAFVPKERLAEAVRGKQEALEIEAAWDQTMREKAGPPPYPRNFGSHQYSVVVFVDVPPDFKLSGRLGIPVQHAKNLLTVNVSLAAGYSGTYVVDGGGLILTRGIPPEPKPYEWLDVHTH